MLTEDGCPDNMRAIKDALDTIEGKWKLLILISLSAGSRRFNELTKELTGISDKMLSKELKALELNKLVKREGPDEDSPVIMYSITNHGKSLQRVMNELYQWGMEHRKEIVGDSFTLRQMSNDLKDTKEH